MKLQTWIGSRLVERGASATEYALLVAGVGVVIVGLIVLFGDSLASSWQGFAAIL